MIPTDQPRSLRDFATLVPASDAVRDALDRFDRTGIDRPEDLRKILGDPTGGVEFGAGVVHKRLESADQS